MGSEGIKLSAIQADQRICPLSKHLKTHLTPLDLNDPSEPSRCSDPRRPLPIKDQPRSPRGPTPIQGRLDSLGGLSAAHHEDDKEECAHIAYYTFLPPEGALGD